MNAAPALVAAFSSGRGAARTVARSVANFAAAGAVVWSFVGVVLTWLVAPRVLAAALAGYAACFGVTEALMLPVGSPSIGWQVPSGWLRGRSPRAASVVWAATLGPGIATRNPLASMWLLLLGSGIAGSARSGLVLGLLVGSLHGAGRALGVVANGWAMRTRSSTDIMLAGVVYKSIDGLFLVALVPLLIALAVR